MDRLPPPLPHRLPWWCSPAGLALGFQIPVILVVAWAGTQGDAGGVLTIRAVRFLDARSLGIAVGMLLVLAAAAAIGSQLRLRAAPAPNAGADAGAGWNSAAATVGLIAVFAYGVWFRDYFFNPALMWGILTGAYEPSREDIELTPGLTSLANFAPVFFSIYAYRLLAVQRALPIALHALAAVLLLLTLFRVYAWSERLALIENTMPLALALALAAMRSRQRLVRGLALAGPYAAIPVVLLLFGVAESSRSWASDTYHGKYGFWSFMAGRLASYYYTSLNNGAGLLATTDWPTWRLEHVGAWLHHLPGLGPRFSALIGVDEYTLTEFFVRHADPEFNSPSGVFAVLLDLGWVGGVIYMATWGLVAGLMHRAYRDGHLVGVLANPLFFIAAFELFRYPYLGESRAFTWVMGMALAALVAREAGRPRWRSRVTTRETA